MTSQPKPTAVTGFSPVASSLPQIGSLNASGSSIEATRPEVAVSRARTLFGCYRKGEANDPETYVAAISAVLAEYAPDIVQQVTDPRRGLPSRVSFLPTVKEVKDACEAIASARAEAKRRKQELDRQMAERRLDEAMTTARGRQPMRHTISYGEFLQRGGERPIGRFEPRPETQDAR